MLQFLKQINVGQWKIYVLFQKFVEVSAKHLLRQSVLQSARACSASQGTTRKGRLQLVADSSPHVKLTCLRLGCWCQGRVGWWCCKQEQQKQKKKAEYFSYDSC